jgi:transcription termination factor Rho
MHAVELAACLALGQRALVVGGPNSGKSTILREIMESVHTNLPGTDMFAIAIDQRPEEIVDWRMEMPWATIHGTESDAPPEAHTDLEHIFDEATAIADSGGNAFIAIDSLATLARALNATLPETDRVLSGGLMATALKETRRHFSLARAYEEGGSLTIVATASVDTGAELDDVVFHELVGTGNMEIRLNPEAQMAGLFPPLDLQGSGTRKDEGIIGNDEAYRRAQLRARVIEAGESGGLMLLFDELDRHRSLEALLQTVDQS